MQIFSNDNDHESTSFLHGRPRKSRTGIYVAVFTICFIAAGLIVAIKNENTSIA